MVLELCLLWLLALLPAAGGTRSGGWRGGGGGERRWPRSYAIANGPDQGFQGEGWFEVEGRPMVTRYGDVYQYEQEPIPLPPHIVREFENATMAITGYEVDVLKRLPDGREVSVSSRDYYNHHYIMAIKSSEAPSNMALPPMLPHHPTAPYSRRTRRALRRQGQGGGEGVPLVTTFAEGNGGEYRLSYHGLSSGYGQLVWRPAFFWPVSFHFINTRSSVGRLEPSSSTAPPGAAYSGLIECPCTTRRVMDRGAGTIDGKPQAFSCTDQLLAQNNTACSMATYRGGLRCCEPGVVLLDVDQQQPEEEEEHFVRVRFYYERYQPSRHRQAFRLYMQTERFNGEYDIPACSSSAATSSSPGSGHQQEEGGGPSSSSCEHVLTTTFTAEDMFTNCSVVSDPWCADWSSLWSEEHGGWFELVYAGGHVHVAGLSLELYDADSGQLLCRNTPQVGGAATKKPQGEGDPWESEGYVSSLPPCVWGTGGPGLQPPPLLHASTRLLSVARYNSSVAHYGAMASWQMRGAFPPTTTTTSTSTAATSRSSSSSSAS